MRRHPRFAPVLLAGMFLALGLILIKSPSPMLVAVGNGTSYGGGMLVCPGAVLDDLALLDLEVVSLAGER